MKAVVVHEYGGPEVLKFEDAPKPALSVEPNATELAEIGKLIDQRKLKVIISQVLPLADAAKAQEQAATGHTRGKIVLRVAEEPVKK